MSYVDDTEYAAQNLIALTMHEEEKLRELSALLEEAQKKFNFYKWDFETSDMNDDFTEAHVMRAFAEMSKAHNEKNDLEPEVVSLRASIGSKQMAVQAMCGALLQLAKQGISLVHGSLGNCPDGRLVESIPLKNIVWQGRNQALHYEDGNFHAQVKALFSQLEQAFGAEFDLVQHQHQSRAKQVVMRLGWTDYAAYRNDMKSLGL